jgi:cytochrome P450
MGVETVDLFHPDVQEDWYPTYAVLHEEAPVYRVPGADMYVLTRYADIAAVVRDSKTFSNEHEKHGGEPLLLFPQAREHYRTHGFGYARPLSVDPPEHAKFRALVDPFFLGEGLVKATPMIEALVDRLIDGFAARGETEIVRDFAEPLPVTVITRLIGFPDEDMPQLKAWSAAWAAPFARGLTLEQEMWVAREGVAFQHYIKGHIDARRAEPRDDIITHLVQAEVDGRPLSDLEIMSMVDHLYIGGNETTTFAITSGLWLMLREPGVYDRLKAEPKKIRTFVEENLRLESPTQGLYRTVTRDTEIRGVPLPKGATVHLRFAAANRDPEVFKCPHMLDLDRGNAIKQMAFSQAEHHCPGSGLSRLEQAIAFRRLLERLSNLRLAPGKNDFTHIPGFVLRALKALHLEFDPA